MIVEEYGSKYPAVTIVSKLNLSQTQLIGHGGISKMWTPGSSACWGDFPTASINSSFRGTRPMPGYHHPTYSEKYG